VCVPPLTLHKALQARDLRWRIGKAFHLSPWHLFPNRQRWRAVNENIVVDDVTRVTLERFRNGP
jgi:DUF1365 family protein